MEENYIRICEDLFRRNLLATETLLRERLEGQRLSLLSTEIGVMEDGHQISRSARDENRFENRSIDGKGENVGCD